MDEIYTAQEMIDSFSESLGVEGAQKLFSEITQEAGFPGKDSFSKDEAMKICMLLKGKQGLAKILGLTLATQIITNSLHK